MEMPLSSKSMIHATLSALSALCLVVGDSIGGILNEKVHYIDQQSIIMYLPHYNVNATNLRMKKPNRTITRYTHHKLIIKQHSLLLPSVV